MLTGPVNVLSLERNWGGVDIAVFTAVVWRLAQIGRREAHGDLVRREEIRRAFSGLLDLERLRRYRHDAV